MIKSFKPFLAVEEDSIFSFRCPHCSSNSCVKIDSLDKFCFWSGFYMCSSCGMSVFQGFEFNYFSSCFVRHQKLAQPIQLSLF